MKDVATYLHVPGQAPRRLRIAGVVRVLDSGNHHPLLCHLEGSGGPAGLWVVKPQDVLSIGNRRDGRINLLAELGGAEVCAWAGVRTPALGVVEFPADPQGVPLGSLPDEWRTEVTEVFKINKGRIAFCCRYLEGAYDIERDSLEEGPYADAVLRSGAALLLADAYMRHDDRRWENPNAVWFDHEIVALDHGASFVQIDQPGATGAEVAARTVIHSTSFREHVFYRQLRQCRDRIDWISLAERLASIPDATIDAMAANWPDELEPYRSKFVEFLKVRRNHSCDIAAQLSELLGDS